MISVTNEDIIYAEKILLKETQHFDEERIAFIKNFNTLDLQAVPGSGKTTALLAKLLILERYLPLANGRGILVISHTNAAVDEIKERIEMYCPKLFAYPNFIGTIQSFVDEFFAIPFFTNLYKEKPFRIDNEIYNETINWSFSRNLKDFNAQEQKNARYFIMSNNILETYRLKIVDNNFQVISSINGKELEVMKPRRGKNWTDFSINEKNRIKEWLINFKLKIIRKGVLHFDDAYMLAEHYITRIPKYPTLLQKRFALLFVDEMQDMDVHQIELLEKVFQSSESNSLIQRVGDENQAIFNGGAIHLESIWKPRDVILYINGSHRLSSKIAAVVQNLALTPNPIEGKNRNADGSEVDIKPIIFTYEDATISKVIPQFASKIVELRSLDLLPINAPHKFMAVAWRKEHDDQNKIALADYWSNFSNSSPKRQKDFSVLEDYILQYDKEKKTLETLRKNILNALLKILRIESIYDESGRVFTKRKLINHFKSLEENEYETLKLNLYQWSINSIRGKAADVIESIRAYIPIFLEVFEKSINISWDFVNNESTITGTGTIEMLNNNFYESDGFSVEVGTVHSAKGQTHTATLYLESYYQKDGNGDNAKSYESQRLSNQILGTQIPSNSSKRVKQSAKMAYVGFSRPTHLLCLAIHKNRFDSVLSEIDEELWDVIEVKA